MNWLKNISKGCIITGATLIGIAIPNIKWNYLPNEMMYLYTGAALTGIGTYFYIVNNKKEED